MRIFLDEEKNGVWEFSINELEAIKKNKNKLIIPRVAHKHIINNLMGMCLNMGEQLINTDAAKVTTTSNQIDLFHQIKKKNNV